MGNPATALHLLLKEWVENSGSTNMQRRSLTGADQPQGLTWHITAMRLLSEVVAEIDRLEQEGRRVGLFRSHQFQWARGILAMNKGWSGNSQGSDEFSDTDLHVLETLADVLDHSPAVPDMPLDQQAVATLMALLDEVLQATDEDPDLEDRLKLHIRRVVRHLQTCVDEYEALAASAAMEALDQVWVAMQAAAAQSSDPTRWEKFRDRFFIPTAAGLLANAPSLALQISQATGG